MLYSGLGCVARILISVTADGWPAVDGGVFWAPALVRVAHWRANPRPAVSAVAPLALIWAFWVALP
jgi:hypothetical protein